MADFHRVASLIRTSYVDFVLDVPLGYWHSLSQ